MSRVTNFFERVAQFFDNSGSDNALSGAEAVVTDYNERQELPNHTTETNGRWDGVERVPISGIFNERVVANLTIDLGEYGDYTITVDIEDELPEFMDSLNLEVADLQTLVDEGHHIPMIRDGGEWRIKWEELDEWDFYQPEAEDSE